MPAYNAKPPAGSPIDWGHPLADGLIYCAPFWSGSGPVVRDLVEGTDLAITNADTNAVWEAGPIGPGVHLDGADDYMTVAASARMRSYAAGSPDAISLEFWIVWDGSGDDYQRLNNQYAGPTIYIDTAAGANQYKLAFYGAVGGIVKVFTFTGSSPLVVGQLYHVVVTYANDATHAMRLYINGTLAQEITTYSGYLNSGATFAVGGRADGARQFNGKFYGVCEWNRQLSAQEVAQLFATPFSMLRRRGRVTDLASLFNLGYNLYRGIGGISNVDFTTTVGTANAGESSKSFLSLGHDASTRYTYVLRPVRQDADGNDLETPDLSCRAEFETDGSGDWLGNRPGQVEFLEAEVISGAQIRLRWRYRTPYGGTAPSDFGIYYQSSPDITPGSPQATESYTREGAYSKTLSLVDGSTYYFAITARTAGGVESHLSSVIGPHIADDSAPDTPTLITSTTF